MAFRHFIILPTAPALRYREMLMISTLRAPLRPCLTECRLLQKESAFSIVLAI